MEKQEKSEFEKEYMSWEEFKERYLSKVKFLADILKLDRDEVIKKVKESRVAGDPRERIEDEDYMFVEGVIDRILDKEGEWEEKPLLYELRKADGAEDIFDEVHRVWPFKPYGGGEVFFKRTPRINEIRFEVGKSDIVDIFLMDRISGGTLLWMCMGEDLSGYKWDVVVKVKQKACLSKAELIKALKDLADALEADFKNCYLPSSDGLIVPDSKARQALLCALYESNPEFYKRVKEHPWGAVETAIKMAGWVDPNVTLDTGLGVMLEKGWPELYKMVLDGKLSPFEALLETEYVHPIVVYEFYGNGWDTEELLKSKWPKIYESVIAGKIQHFEALMKADLVNKKYVSETFGSSEDIEEVLKSVEPELYEGVLRSEISPFRALLEADFIDPIVLYRTLTFREKIEDVYEVQIEEIEESGEQPLQELEDLLQ